VSIAEIDEMVSVLAAVLADGIGVPS
jgi:hypothetical protein